jgi:hypothetical protein
MAKLKSAAKRELINTGKDKRFVRRGTNGRFKESDDVSRSLKRDPSAEGQAEGEERAGGSGRQVRCSSSSLERLRCAGSTARHQGGNGDKSRAGGV